MVKDIECFGAEFLSSCTGTLLSFKVIKKMSHPGTPKKIGAESASKVCKRYHDLLRL